jgi:non-ribosomal peptide synthetase component F
VVCTAPGNLGIAPGTRVGHILNIAFDMAVWETFATLANGGTICLRGSGREGSTCLQFEKIFNSVNVIICTPTILEKFDPDLYPDIRLAALAGERCSQQLADRWTKAGKRLLNSCGPTEVI